MAGGLSATNQKGFSGPSPWWQGNDAGTQNLIRSAPAGYYYDVVKGNYEPIAGSPQDLLDQRNRSHGIEDNLLSRFYSSMDGLGAANPGNYGSPGWASLDSGPSANILKSNNDAIYARAKDDAARTATSALRGLSERLGARGMGGAGYEAGQIGQEASEAANSIGDVSRQNAQNQYNQAIARGQANLGAQVSQRGQDIGAATARRGQDLEQQRSMTQALQGLINSSRSSISY